MHKQVVSTSDLGHSVGRRKLSALVTTRGADVFAFDSVLKPFQSSKLPVELNKAERDGRYSRQRLRLNSVLNERVDVTHKAFI